MAGLERRWVAWLIGGLILVFLGVDFALPFLLDSRWEWIGTVLLGVCIAQLNLIAAWAALGPGNVVLRLPWSLLLVVLMWYALMLGNHAADRGTELRGAVLLGVNLFVGFAAAQIPLWIAAWAFRWRLIRKTAEPGPMPSDRFQFRILHLLAATTFLAVALAPARVVLPQGSLKDFHWQGVLWVILAGAVLGNLLVTVPCIWGAFLRKSLLAPVAIGWLVYCAVLTAAEYQLLSLLGPFPDRAPMMMYGMNLAQCATVFGTLLILRAAGFRLRRQSKLRGDQKDLQTLKRRRR